MLDHFSWITGLTYTYPHWLFSVIIYFIYNNFGFTGIYIGTIICYITIAITIYYVNLKINKNNILALVVTIMGIISLNIFIEPRAQLISIILLFLEVFFINRLIDTGKKKYSFYLIICSLILANVHGTIWPVFFIFFMPFFGEHLVYLYSKKSNKKITFNNRLSVNKINNTKLLVITFIICLLMGLLTPSRICYTYFLKIMLGDSQNIIEEHKALVLINNPLIIISLVLLFFSKSKIRLSEFLMITGITIMTLISTRHLIFFFTIGILYLSVILKRNIDETKDKTLTILEEKFTRSKIIPIILIILVLIVSYFKFNTNIKKYYINENYYPVKVVNYIKENLDYKNIKIINDYDIGSYLLFNDIKVFVDSRCDLYYKEFNNINILNDYLDYFSFEKQYNYDGLLDKYSGDYILVDNTNPVYYMLIKDNNYKEVYNDNRYALYQKIVME